MTNKKIAKWLRVTTGKLAMLAKIKVVANNGKTSFAF